MKIRLLAPAVVLTAALTASCSAQSPSEPPEPAGTRTASEEPADEPTAEDAEPVEAEEASEASPEPNERGNLVKQVGETAGLTDDVTGEWTLDFKVTAIIPGYECTSGFADPSVNGQFVALRFEVNTTAAWDSEMMGDFMMSAHDFQAFDASNMRVNDPVGAASMCPSDAEMLPQTMGPAQSANGTIVLDLPAGPGIVAYRPMYLQTGGWEWAYGG